MYDDFEDLDILDDDEDELLEDKPRSRTFTVIAGVLGVLIVFAIITVAAFLLFSNKDANTNNTADTDPAIAQTETAQAQQKFIGESLTQTAVALAGQAQATEPPPTATATQEAASPTQDTAATIQAAYTQAVALQTEQAGTAATDDELPDTGLIDDLGIPGILAFSTLLFLVIIIVRRVRASNT
jgi:flagellar basal body-associated protein FliL